MLKLIITASSVCAIGLYFGLQNEIMAVPQEQVKLAADDYIQSRPELEKPESEPKAKETQATGPKSEIFIKEPILESKVELAQDSQPIADIVTPNSGSIGILTLLESEKHQSDEANLVDALLEVDLTSIVEDDLRNGRIKVGKSNVAAQNIDQHVVEFNSIDDVVDSVQVKGKTIILRKERVSLLNHE